MNTTALVAASSTLLLAATLAHAGPVAVFTDDFSDDAIAPQWSAITDNPSDLTLIETGGSLGVSSTGLGATTDDALYLSNGPAGFQLSTADSFNMQIDYDFGVTGDSSSALEGLALVFGIGEDLDGQNSAAIGFGSVNAGLGVVNAATVATRTDDVETVGLPDLTVPASGTFVVDYDASVDALTFTAGTFSANLTGLVEGTWDADLLFVSFGARGNGFATDPSVAFLDNFAINTGTLVVVPEPASMGLLAFAGLALRRRR